MKNIIYKLSALFLVLVALYSCTDNDMKYIATMPEAGKFTLTPSDTALVLSKTDASTHTAISLKWDSLTYGISTPVTYTIQMDTLNGDFSTPVEEEVAVNKYSVSYTDSVLNKKLLNQLKLKGDVKTSIQIRLKANMAFGNNPVYSNVLKIGVTPYSVVKQAAFLYMPGVSGDWNDYSVKLCSKNNDGNYEGFVNAAQWANFKFSEKADGGGAWYGSSPSGLYTLDGTAGMWNIWFDEGGYFLVKANTNNMTWSKTAITSFAVTGVFNSWSLTATPMTYDSSTKKWSVTCNISTVQYGIQIIANQNWDSKYGDTDKNGSLVLGGDNLVISTPGTYTITMDLSNPEKYTYTIK